MRAQSLFGSRGYTVSGSLPWPGARGTHAAGDVVLQVLILLATAMAPVVAACDAVLRPRRTVRLVSALRSEGLRAWSELRRMWLVRTLREVLRLACAIGLENAALRRIVLRGNVAVLRRPAVLAVYHSPWARLLGRWLARSGDVLLLAGTPWTRRVGSCYMPATSQGMRRVLRELRRGRSVAVTIDHFWERGRLSRATRVLGQEAAACMGAARLAARAGVPLVPVSLRWTGSYLEVELGQRLTVGRETVGPATAAVLAQFDRAVRRDLSSWANAHRFLSGVMPGRWSAGFSGTNRDPR